MIVIDSVKQSEKKGKYNVKVGLHTYLLDEDIIVEYNLYHGKEMQEEVLEKALKSNDLNEYYNKAMNYALKYMKCSGEVYDYLVEKGLEKADAVQIVNKLQERKLIDDSHLAELLANSLARAGNGKMLIKEKMIAKRYRSAVIEEALNHLDMDDYYKAMFKLYEKNKHKYDKDNDYNRINKLKRYFMQRGYSSSDISLLEIR